MKNSKRFFALMLSLMLLMGSMGAIAEAGSKWTQTEMEDGWIKIENDGGATLGYSPDSGVTIIDVDGYAFKDLNKNGSLDVYEDWRVDADTRARELANTLTGEEVAGLMLHPMISNVSENAEEMIEMLDAGLRTALNGATAYPVDVQAKWNNTMQAYVEAKNHGIPVNISTNPRTSGVWPNNLAMASTFDPKYIEEISRGLAKDYRALGIVTLLGPQIDLATEPRWPRFDGTFGEDPALARDMTHASVVGHQSTYDADGTDLGWGPGSVNAMIKHWPSDGAGESGRESHDWYGKYTVYPGDQFETGLIPFVDGGFNVDSLTGSAAAIMSSYAIAWNEDGSLGELVGSAFSEYKNTLARNYGFDGLICSDWGVVSGNTGWGVEELDAPERGYIAIASGTDQIGGLDDITVATGAYAIAVEDLGEEAALVLFRDAAYRILKTSFQTALFENPYVSVADAVKIVGGEEAQAAGYESQLKTIVMLKNTDNVIKASESDDKPTVYVPLVHTPAQVKYGGYMIIPASAVLPIERDILDQYFNVVTDTISAELTGPADKDGNVTVAYEDIIKATPEELAACDYAFVVARSPQNIVASMVSAGYSTEKETFVPVSLQYGPYVADGENVRTESIAGDMTETEIASPYGVQKVQEKTNSSYYGEEAEILNATELDMILYAAENIPEAAKLIVAINATNPMVVSEFEDKADAILMGFDAHGKAYLDIFTGKAEPSALLPFQMPLNMDTVEAQKEDVPRDMECYVDANGNTYDFAYGLNWAGVINDERVAKYAVEPITTPQAQPITK